MTATLASPQEVQGRLEEIETDLATRLNEYEAAAMEWFRIKPKRERRWAESYISTNGPAHIRKVAADAAVADEEWAEAEGRYEVLKVIVRGLEAKASIGQSILRSQSRLP